MERIMWLSIVIASLMLSGWMFVHLVSYADRKKARLLKEEGKLPYFDDEKVHVSANEWGYIVEGMTINDLMDMLSMIKGAKLPERRTFENLRKNIEDVLELASK